MIEKATGSADTTLGKTDKVRVYPGGGIEHVHLAPEASRHFGIEGDVVANPEGIHHRPGRQGLGVADPFAAVAPTTDTHDFTAIDDRVKQVGAAASLESFHERGRIGLELSQERLLIGQTPGPHLGGLAKRLQCLVTRLFRLHHLAESHGGVVTTGGVLCLEHAVRKSAGIRKNS